MSLIPHYLKVGEKVKAKKIYYEAVKLAPLGVRSNIKYLLYFFVDINKIKIYTKKLIYLGKNKLGIR